MSPRLLRSLPALGVLLLLAVLLFAHLGHYALWSDEAATALHAQGILETGDTTALVGRNLVACDGGINLRHFCERLEPPLQSYLAAPFLGLFGPEAWAARLPFAALGFLLAFLAWRQMESRRVSFFAQALAAAAVLGNVSLILYFRQSRYYGPAIAFSVALVFLWLHWRALPPEKRSPWHSFALSLLAILLFAATPLNAAALFFCLALDWTLWQRKDDTIPRADLLRLALPAAVGIGLILSVWNPLATLHGTEATKRNGASFLDHFTTLFLWNWRDMNRCEFFSGLLLVATIPVGLCFRDIRLLRGLLAAVAYVAIISAVSPQDLWGSRVADVRYLVPLIPLFLFLEVLLLLRLAAWNRFAALLVALVAFGTNLLNGGGLAPIPEPLRSTPLLYAGELFAPPGDPYTLASQWINQTVPEGASIWARPAYAAYPLMFHAPKAVYAWQLENPPQNPELHGLPEIHYQGIVPPDYIVVFGAEILTIRPLLEAWRKEGTDYEEQGGFLFPGHDYYRPELFWRVFHRPETIDPGQDAIYFFRRK